MTPKQSIETLQLKLLDVLLDSIISMVEIESREILNNEDCFTADLPFRLYDIIIGFSTKELDTEIHNFLYRILDIQSYEIDNDLDDSYSTKIRKEFVKTYGSLLTSKTEYSSESDIEFEYPHRRYFTAEDIKALGVQLE